MKTRILFFYLHLLILSLKLKETNSCPTDQKCTKCSVDGVPRKISIVCLIENKSEKNLSKFLDLNPTWGKNYELLKIQNKNFTSLIDYQFKEIYFNILDLSQNEIVSISEKAFSNMTGLYSLILSDNNLKSIDNFISGLSLFPSPKMFKVDLTYLDLSNNLISTINVQFTQYFKQLKEITFRRNKIVNFSEYLVFNLKSIQKLDLSSNALDFCLAKTIYLPNLVSLILEKNFIKKCDRFLYLIKLKNLDFSYNQLEYLPNEFFSNLTSLQLFNIQNNKIVLIKNNIFNYDNSTLKGFKEIYLQHNKINTIEENSFLNLKNLEILDLRFNKIEFIFKNSFGNLSNLKYLGLSFNKIFNIENDCFLNLNSLKYLDIDLEYNLIENINNRSFLGMNAKSLKLNRNKVNILQANSFGNIISLYLSNMKIKILQIDCFKGMKNLEILKIDYNQISVLKNEIFNSLGSIKSLILSFNIISSIENFTFKYLDTLEKLELNNNFISNIEFGTFNGLKSLTKLNLGNNLIKKLKSNTFVNLGYLETLNLSFNLISHIEPNSFINMSNIKYLDLSSNKLDEIRNFYFLNLKNLEYLNLSDNKLFYIEFNSFNSLSLLTLDLTKNYLNKLEINYTLTLRKLEIENNRLLTLGKNFSAYFPNLKSLNLRYNHLTIIKDFVFKEILDLSKNHIEELSGQLFNFITRAKILNLNSNKIKSLKFLSQLNMLTSLDLSNNSIEFIYKNDFINLTDLHFLFLANNPIIFIDSNAFFL